MKGREHLRSIQYRRIEVLALEDAVLEIETRLTRISPVLSDMPHATGNTDKMTDGISRLIELKAKLNHMIDEAAKFEDEAIEMIKRLPNPTFRTILYRLYIIGDSLEKVSVAINYSYYYTCKMHGYALNELDKHDNQSQ